MPTLHHVGSRLRAAARALIRPAPTEQPRLPVAIPGGVIDAVLVGRSGHVDVVGWSERDGELPPVQVRVDGAVARRCLAFRVPRPDVTANRPVPARLPGFVQRFAAPPEIQRMREVFVLPDGGPVVKVPADMAVRRPDYANLFDETRVLRRDDIYGVGPPAQEISVELFEMARLLPGPLLDFGCGSGAMVRALRAAGTDARGIELSRPEIRDSLAADVAPFVTLYDGSFPLPFKDGQFASVLCSEVLEHIPDYGAAVREMARVAARALITVPDMTAVPALHPHFVVPWHLLEATHVNFFTQASLEALLAQTFPRLSFSRLGRFEVNGTTAYTSIVAICG